MNENFNSQETPVEEPTETQIIITNHFASYTWSQILLRGLLAIFMGVSAFLYPKSMILAIVIVTAAFWLVDGITLLVASLSGEVHGGVKTWFIIRAIIGILAGIAVFINPIMSTIFIVWFMVIMLAVMTMISGIHEIIFGGALYVLFSLVLISSPLLAAKPIVRVIGIFVALGGVALTAFALKLRAAAKE